MFLIDIDLRSKNFEIVLDVSTWCLGTRLFQKTIAFWVVKTLILMTVLMFDNVAMFFVGFVQVV